MNSKNSRSSLTQPRVKYHHPGFHPDSRHHWRLRLPWGHWWLLHTRVCFVYARPQSPPICRSLFWSSRTYVRYSLEARHNCILPTCILNPVLMNSLSHEPHESGNDEQSHIDKSSLTKITTLSELFHITHSDLCKPSCQQRPYSRLSI